MEMAFGNGSMNWRFLFLKRGVIVLLFLAGLISLVAGVWVTNEAGSGEPVSDELVPTVSATSTPLAGQIEGNNGRSYTITIQEGNQQQILHTTAPTVGAALNEAGITLYAADNIDPPPDTPLSAGLHIQITRSFPVTLVADGRILQIRTHKTNPLDIIAEAGIGLIGADYTRPGPETTIRPGDTIEVIRVTEEFLTEDEPIPYQTLWQATDELEIDQRAVLSYGVPGIRRRRIRVRYENGVEVSRTVDGEWVAREPVNEVIGYGTKIVIRTMQTPEGPVEYWRVVRMRVTSYTAASSGKEPGEPGYGITASGVPAGTGVVAVDRSIVPFRSYVYVPGYGIGFVGDTGGGVRGRWIDLGYDEDEFVSWSGYVDVYYLTPVPPPEDINYLLPTVLP
ncbi:MAG: DUF348 domain-containing protein [Chloroflexi bacterium]|nr:MAG: DUF348 domain-containing protein [Chloroflexota bacterium]